MVGSEGKCGTQRGAERKERERERSLVDSATRERRYKGGATEEVTWDSIAVPSVTK